MKSVLQAPLLTFFLALAALQEAFAQTRSDLEQGVRHLEVLLLKESYRDAAAFSDSLQGQVRAFFGENHLDTLYFKALFTHGRVLFFKGEYAASVASLERCLPLGRQLYGPENVAVAKVLTNIGINQAELRAAPKAIEAHLQALAIYEKQNLPWMPALADCWNNLANAQADNRENETALQSYDKALRIRYRNEGPNSGGVAALLQNAAGCHLALGDLDEAAKGYQAALAIFKKLPRPRPVSEAHAWYNLGVCHELAENLDAALLCHENSLKLREAHLRADHPHTLSSLRGLAAVYRNMGDFDRAEYYFTKVMEVRRASMKMGNSLLTGSFIDIGVIAGDRGDWPKAEAMFLKAIQSEMAAPVFDSSNMSRTLSRYGGMKYKQRLLDSAILLQQQALAVHPRSGKGIDQSIAAIHVNLAECYLLRKDFALADSFFLLHLQRIAPAKSPVKQAYAYRRLAESRMLQGRFEEASGLLDSVFERLQVLDSLNWGQTLSQNDLALAMLARGRLFLRWAQASGAEDYLHQALYWGETTLSYLAQWEKSLAGSSSPRDILQLAREAREICVAACHRLMGDAPPARQSEAWLGRAFSYMDAAHGSQLLSVLADAQNTPKTGKSDPMKALEHALRSNIAIAEKEIYLARSAGFGESSDTILRNVNLLFAAKRSLDSLLAEQGVEPRALVRRPTASLPKVQNKALRPGQALLEYLLVDSLLYLLYATQQNSGLLALPLGEPLQKTVSDCREGLLRYHTLDISNPQRTSSRYEQALKQYVGAAHLLYRQLISPALPFIQGKQDLLIVPDGPLHLLPFSVLLRERPAFLGDFDGYAFLAKEANIGQAFSTYLHQETGKPGSAPFSPERTLVMAPFFTGDVGALPKISSQGSRGRTGMDSLPYSGVEAYKVHQRLGGGKVRYGGGAALDTFLAHAPGADILHLSTHAIADRRFGEYCYVAFGKNGPQTQQLFVRDIYALKLPAKLVVLSSCESAGGELQRGEGLVGLSRAFASAGAQSVVSSVWQVDDASAATLMEQFYAGLVSPGTPKDHALGMALRHFLADPNLPNEQKHPYFWAAFTVTGNLSALR
jgi:CHAT domain-containing protein